jgi:hypothetical protein
MHGIQPSVMKYTDKNEIVKRGATSGQVQFRSKDLKLFDIYSIVLYYTESKLGNARLISDQRFYTGLTLVPECRCRIETDDYQKNADAGLTLYSAFLLSGFTYSIASSLV